MSLLALIGARLDRLTTHRLTLYALLGMVLWAVALSMLGVLGYHWWDVAGAAILATGIAVGVNHALARLLRATTDPQSSIITALILSMLGPVGLRDHWVFLAAAAAVAIASKYIVTVDKQHIFNPAVVAVAAIPMLFPGAHATWWIGTAPMLPAVAVLGLLVVMKTRRTGVVLTFLTTYLLIAAAASVWDSRDAALALDALRTILVSTAVVFFAFVMMTDPITIPSSMATKHAYAGFVAVMYATPELRFLSLAATPEIALCIGNAVSFAIRPKYRLLIALKKAVRVGPDTWAIDFASPRDLAFAPGQYMEWTMPHTKPDGRGQRRYFTIASSPTEDDLKVVMRVPERCSTYKRALVTADEGAPLVAARLAGDFVLPRDLTSRLAFLAGGVGIAPFRSMARYIVDKNLACDIVLVYCCRRVEDFLFIETFESARRLGFRTVYALGNHEGAPANWAGRLGGITADALRTEIPDFPERTFFLSGSHRMVDSMERVLRGMGVGCGRMRKDYFDGAADS